MTNEITRLVSTLDVILEGIISEGIILAVLIPWVYPLNHLPMKL